MPWWRAVVRFDPRVTDAKRRSALDSTSRLALVCGAAAAVALLALVPHRIAEGGYLNRESGTWAALADDLAHGVLYRPLLSNLGYGGTRYFPLHIVLHGLLARAGFSLRVAGHLLSLAATAALIAGGALGLSRRGAPAALAWSVGILALTSRNGVAGAAGIRGDLLPVALGVLGLAFSPRDRRDSPVVASICFGMALLAKPTLVWAPAGAVLSLIATGNLRSALKVAGIVTGITVAALGGAIWASHGEMLVSFRACGSGGGFSLSTLLTGLSFVRPGDLAWILGGVGLTLLQGRGSLSHPFSAAALVCLPVTILVFTSRGTHVNHFFDSTAIGALAVGVALSIEAGGRRIWARRVLAVATLLGIAEAVLLDGMPLKRNELEEAVAALPDGSGPLLSEQPWIPLLAGERAFSIDAYSLLLTRRVSPAIDQDLLSGLDHCRFRAVVLQARPENVPWYFDMFIFGPGFREHLLATYRLASIAGAHAIYIPHCDSLSPTSEAAGPTDSETIEERAHGGFLRGLLARIRSLHP